MDLPPDRLANLICLKTTVVGKQFLYQIHLLDGINGYTSNVIASCVRSCVPANLNTACMCCVTCYYMLAASKLDNFAPHTLNVYPLPWPNR